MAVARHAVAHKRAPSRVRRAPRRAVYLAGLHCCIRRRPPRTAPAALPLIEPVGNAEQLKPAGSIRDDLRLFATTFAAGFLFVSILIG